MEQNEKAFKKGIILGAVVSTFTIFVLDLLIHFGLF